MERCLGLLECDADYLVTFFLAFQSNLVTSSPSRVFLQDCLTPQETRSFETLAKTHFEDTTHLTGIESAATPLVEGQMSQNWKTVLQI